MSTGAPPPEQPEQPEQPQQPGATPPPGYGYPPPPPGYGSPAQPGYGYPPARGHGQPPMRPDEEKLWAIAAHLGPLLLGFIAPLVVWLAFRERSAFLERQGKEALNFQITLLIAYAVCFVLAFVLIGFLLFAVVWVASLVFMILAAVRVGNLEDYRYPVNIRLIP